MSHATITHRHRADTTNAITRERHMAAATSIRASIADRERDLLNTFAPANSGARRMPITVTGPDNRPVGTHWLLLPDGTGLVELASTSGISLLGRPRPMTAHTRGFGQAIIAALNHGVTRLILTIDGSCSTDGGTGVLRELGVAFLDAHDRPIRDGGIGLAELATIDLSGIRRQPTDGVIVLTDDTCPLLGPGGAAHALAPRTGATSTDVAELRAGLRRLASFQLLPSQNGRPAHQIAGSGAAGGIEYGLRVWSAHAGAE
jgi:glycerate kinase